MKIKTNLGAGIMGIVMGVIILLLIPSQVQMSPRAYEQLINQQTMVYLSAWIMIVSGLVLVVRSLALKKDKTKTVNLKMEAKTLLFWGVILAAVLLMKKITFLGSSTVIILYVLIYTKTKNVLTYVGCFAFAVAVYCVFKFLLNVPLP